MSHQDYQDHVFIDGVNGGRAVAFFRSVKKTAIGYQNVGGEIGAAAAFLVHDRRLSIPPVARS